MDTTSHEFVWEMDTVGTMASVLRDVCMFSENEIWAVGTIYVSAASGQTGLQRGNLVRWNGVEWNVEEAQFPICDASGNELGTAPIDGISVSCNSPTDIWCVSSVSLLEWNGKMFKTVCMPLGYGTRDLLRMWRSFLIGTSGFVAHHDGFSWQQMMSGTTLDLRDIWGTSDGLTVWACGHDSNLLPSILLEYDGSAWRTVKQVSSSDPLYADSLSGIIRSVWSSGRWDAEVATSAGMYRVQPGSVGEARRTWLPAWGSVGLFNRVRGSARNNIFAVGEFGTIAHYNGVTWHQYTEFFDMSGDPVFLSVAATEQMVVAVGYAPEGGIVLVGKR
jgi:hypothetical protein